MICVFDQILSSGMSCMFELTQIRDSATKLSKATPTDERLLNHNDRFSLTDRPIRCLKPESQTL